MTTNTTDRAREKGIALVYVGVFLVPLLLCTGLAVDLGRGYLVRVALAKAVDAAALAAARNIAGDQSRARDIAINIFQANFPGNFLGVSDVKSPPDVNFQVDDKGSNVITVSSNATLPTTFMRIAKFDSLTVSAAAVATRHLVDMSFVIDRSGSLGPQFDQVKAAAEQFVDYFDDTSDRIALITFSGGTTVVDEMPLARGFSKDGIKTDIQNASSSGPTATPEALYEAWDQLRRVPPDSQGLRLIVLFTDGSPNAFPGDFRQVATTEGTCGSPIDSPNPAQRLPDAIYGTISAIDYPKVQSYSFTTNTPFTVGLYDTTTGNSVPPTDIGKYRNQFQNSAGTARGSTLGEFNRNTCIPYLPPRSSHHPRSSGMPLGFPIGRTLPYQRDMVGAVSVYGYEGNARNAYNAARNLAETIADAIRSDTSGSSKIRIYTLGLGDLLNVPLGSPGESGSDLLKTIANQSGAIGYNSTQLEGRYYFAGNADELFAAFNSVRDDVVRLAE